MKNIVNNKTTETVRENYNLKNVEMWHATSYTQNSKANSAITLIALIITIIVLLILAGVTLSLVLGENGIINKARNSKRKDK